MSCSPFPSESSYSFAHTACDELQSTFRPNHPTLITHTACDELLSTSIRAILLFCPHRLWWVAVYFPSKSSYSYYPHRLWWVVVHFHPSHPTLLPTPLVMSCSPLPCEPSYSFAHTACDELQSTSIRAIVLFYPHHLWWVVVHFHPNHPTLLPTPLVMSCSPFPSKSFFSLSPYHLRWIETQFHPGHPKLYSHTTCDELESTAICSIIHFVPIPSDES